MLYRVASPQTVPSTSSATRPTTKLIETHKNKQGRLTSMYKVAALRHRRRFCTEWPALRPLHPHPQPQGLQQNWKQQARPTMIKCGQNEKHTGNNISCAKTHRSLRRSLRECVRRLSRMCLRGYLHGCLRKSLQRVPR